MRHQSAQCEKSLTFCLPTKTEHSLNAAAMLGQHRIWWANIETALGECLDFAVVHILGQYNLWRDNPAGFTWLSGI